VQGIVASQLANELAETKIAFFPGKTR